MYKNAQGKNAITFERLKVKDEGIYIIYIFSITYIRHDGSSYDYQYIRLFF